MFQIKNGKILEETLAGLIQMIKNSIETSTLFQNTSLSFASSSKISPFLCHFVTHSRE